MNEVVNEPKSKPGIVIFVALLNFFSSMAWLIGAALFTALLIFGNAVGFYQTITNRLQERLAGQNLAIGLNAVFSFFLILSLFFAGFHLLIGIGLLKAKGAAWYVQIVTAIMGLILIPYGTVVSIVILVFFFRSNVRSFFKV